MSTQLEREPARTLPHPSLAPSTAPAAVQRPLVWLLTIMAVAVALRGWSLTAPLQQDEFTALAAVAERAALPGTLPSTNEPLLPVAGLEAVRERSVLPFGIPQPLPLFHYLLYGVLQFLPAAEWSLRLPSLLAGLASIAAIYWLCRRFLGTEAALVAALLTAADPMQVGVSVLSQPYALANFACILSFITLLGLFRATEMRGALLYAVGYAATLVAVGYFSPASLFVLVAQIGFAVYAVTKSEQRSYARLMLWLGGVVTAFLLLIPQIGYVVEVVRFARANHDVLSGLAPKRLEPFLVHNNSFLAALLVVSVVGYVLREMRSSQKDAVAATEPEPPESPEIVWAGRVWLFLPQALALMLTNLLDQPVFLSRFLSYTTLGGVLLLAYWASRDRSRDVRLGMALALAVTLLVWGFTPTTWQQRGLYSSPAGRGMVDAVNKLDESGKWQPGDVLLYRPTLIEADLLPDRVAAAVRPHVERALLAPLSTLYTGSSPKPVLTLSQSNRFGKRHTRAGAAFPAERFYNESLAHRLCGHGRFWLCTDPLEDDQRHTSDQRDFLACFLPWLAESLQWDLQVARQREKADRYFDVPTGVRPDDYVAGLSDSKASDFARLFLVKRKQPRGIFLLGLLTAAPQLNPHVTIPAWVATYHQTPRRTQKPETETALEE